jgi:hypothetical protein
MKNRSAVETFVKLSAVVFAVVRKTSVRIVRNLMVSLFLAVNLSRNVRVCLTL